MTTDTLAEPLPRTRFGPAYYWAAYLAHLRVGIALMVQYRFAMLIWAVWGFVGPLVSLAVWTAAAGKGGSITNTASGSTFSRSDFTAYFLTFMVFAHLTMSWDAFDFPFRVRTGLLSVHLLKPIHPIHADAANNISFKLATSAMLLPVWALLFWLLKPTPPPSLWLVALAVPAVVLAAIIRYILQYALAAIAFWTTRTEAVNQFYFTLDSFLAGRIAPLALMPLWMGAIAHYSPFRAMGAFPVELVLGRLSPSAIAEGFLLQALWLIGAWLLLRAVWNAGVKQYSAVGA